MKTLLILFALFSFPAFSENCSREEKVLDQTAKAIIGIYTAKTEEKKALANRYQAQADQYQDASWYQPYYWFTEITEIQKKIKQHTTSAKHNELQARIYTARTEQEKATAKKYQSQGILVWFEF